MLIVVLEGRSLPAVHGCVGQWGSQRAQHSALAASVASRYALSRSRVHRAVEAARRVGGGLIVAATKAT